MIRKLAVCASFIMATSFAIAQTIVTELTSTSTVTSNGINATTIKSLRTSAILPSISASNNILCIGADLC